MIDDPKTAPAPERGDWGLVMDAYYKGTAKRVQQNKTRKQRHKQVFGSDGIKMTCEEIRDIFLSGGFIVDVRNPVEYLTGGRVHNSVNVPEDKLLDWCRDHEKISYNTPILVYSNNGRLSQTAKKDLEDYGYKNVTNIGTHRWYTLCS